MGKTIRSARQNKLVPVRGKSKAGDYQPTRKFHRLKAVPVRQFKAELTARESLTPE